MMCVCEMICFVICSQQTVFPSKNWFLDAQLLWYQKLPRQQRTTANMYLHHLICLFGQIIDRIRTWSITNAKWINCTIWSRIANVDACVCGEEERVNFYMFQCVTKRNKMSNKDQMPLRRRRRRRKKWHTSIGKWIIRFCYLLRIYLNEVYFSFPFFSGVRISGRIVLDDALTQCQMILFVHHQI